MPRQVDERVDPLRAGELLPLRTEAGTVEVVVGAVAQRNWSRVARASSADGRDVFLKQFVDRAGRARPDDLANERAGLDTASRLPSVDTVPLLGAADGRLVLASTWADLAPVDVLLRTAPTEEFGRRWRGTIVPALAALLDDLVAGLELAPAASSKPRRWASTGEVLGFKGLDVRNLALPAARASGRLVLFDPGKPYRAPVEEAAAKLVVSVGLLNWGSPIERFRQGVPVDLVGDVLVAIGGRTNPDALADELALQRRIRLEGLPTGSGLGGAARRAAVRALGRRYLHDLETVLADARA